MIILHYDQILNKFIKYNKREKYHFGFKRWTNLENLCMHELKGFEDIGLPYREISRNVLLQYRKAVIKKHFMYYCEIVMGDTIPYLDLDTNSKVEIFYDSRASLNPNDDSNYVFNSNIIIPESNCIIPENIWYKIVHNVGWIAVTTPGINDFRGEYLYINSICDNAKRVAHRCSAREYEIECNFQNNNMFKKVFETNGKLTIWR